MSAARASGGAVQADRPAEAGRTPRPPPRGQEARLPGALPHAVPLVAHPAFLALLGAVAREVLARHRIAGAVAPHEAGAVPARADGSAARFLDVSSHTLAPLPERSGGGVFSGGRAAGVRGAVAGPEGARA